MSATNNTTYYNLPIFIGTDTPSWLGDWNKTMTDIDNAINNAHNEAENASNTANKAIATGDGNTKSIDAIMEELSTLKKAVQNYDSILDFNPVNLAVSPNNTETGSVAYLVQNTNKTLNRLWLSMSVKNPLNNPTTYTYTRENSETSTWYDLFTVEDNVFKLNQTSLPHYNNVLTVAPCVCFKEGKADTVVFLRAWFDGATTHFGIDTNRLASAIQGYYISCVAPVFLSGSVYNPDVVDNNM